VISGIVIDRHAIVTITFRPPRLRDFPIQFVIDTGFTEEICLPPEAVALLGLPFKFNLPVNLADNSEVVLPVHSAIIIWNGEEREIGVFATGRRPLIGTRLLDDHELVIQFVENGLVTILLTGDTA
jgi:clan AA aspartic protease